MRGTKKESLTSQRSPDKLRESELTDMLFKQLNKQTALARTRS